jgi:hypothetical protein
MAEERPDVYGPMTPYCPPMTILIVNWNNVQGDKLKFDQYDGKYCGKEIFQKIQDRTKHLKKGLGSELLNMAGHWLMPLIGLDPNKAYKLSELDKILGFGPRYGANPYLGMDRWNKTYKVAENGFAKVTAELIQEATLAQGVYPTPQWGSTGGKHSATRKENCGNPICVLSHRDATVSNVYYIHYDNVEKGKDVTYALEVSQDVMAKSNTAYDTVFGPGDNRWLAFCGEDEDLDLVHKYYYDTEEDYLELLRIKRTVDPYDIFTPNLYCVGASRKYKTALPNSPALDQEEEPTAKKARIE